MWIVLNHAFLSIVASDKEPDKLAVRARAKGDIERVFPGVKVFAWKNRDYAYRAFIPRETVAAAIAAKIAGIEYPNFKSSVAEHDRAAAYHDIWDVMADFQEDRGHGAPYRTHAVKNPVGRGRHGLWPRPRGRKARRATQERLWDGFDADLDRWPGDLLDGSHGAPEDDDGPGGLHRLTDDQFRALEIAENDGSLLKLLDGPKRRK